MKLNTHAIAKSTVGVIWLIVVMTVLTEISAAFKSILVSFAGHHWVAKSLISVLLFFVLYLLFRKSDETRNISVWIYSALGSVVLGGIIILSFFAFESL